MASAPAQDLDLEAVRERLRTDTPYWAEKFGRVINKDMEEVPLVYKPGQRAFDEVLEGQRAEDKPMRVIVLKARKVGISTATQAKLIHRCTLRAHYRATVVAQDKGTGELLYDIGERIYTGLPKDPELKPALGRHRRNRFLHFAGDGLWQHGEAYPDSTYFVDTAGEFQSGRGATPSAIHASEVAFWPQIGTKLTALKNSVPRRPETMFIIESTANGYNEFKDIWDDAEAGRGSYVAFFWPWWKEAEYQLEFINATEREAFVVGDPTNPYAEEEVDLVKNLGLTFEQLNWRRQTIVDECGGDVRMFHQEYPSTAEEAFISTGGKVFDPYKVGQLMRRVERTDPKPTTEENPGPLIGDFAPDPDSIETMTDRAGNDIEVPTKALWVPRERGGPPNPTAPMRLWLPADEHGQPIVKGDFITAADVAGGNSESTEGRETDYHALQVIDHRTRMQVLEYRSRIEPEQFLKLAYLAAIFFNRSWLAIERTGGHAVGLLRILWLDYHYEMTYRGRNAGTTNERLEKRLGWDTTTKTKPELIAGMAGLLQEEEDGIQSRLTADEVRTLTREENGSVKAEPGKFDDCFMAYAIAQQVAREKPLDLEEDEDSGDEVVVAGESGLTRYDPRYG